MAIEVKSNKDPLSDLNDLELILNYLHIRQIALSRLSPYQKEVGVQIEGEPVLLRVNHVGDTHLAHDDSDPYALVEAVKEAGEQGMMGHDEKKGKDILRQIVKKEGDEALTVLQGNIIDGVSSKFISTNTSRVGLPLDEQEKLARAILEPIKKNLVAVSGNTCHEGWAKKTATHDPTPSIVGGVPVLYTGGQIIFSKGNREVGRLEVYHNPGKGDTPQSPEGAIRARYREISSQQPRSPDAIISGHTHKLVAGQDISRNPITGEERKVSLGVVGTAKGTYEQPDQFLIGLGVPPRNQPADSGRGLVTIWRYNDNEGRLDSYPVADYRRARVLYEATLLYELARRANALEDLEGFILQTGLFQEPNVTLNKDESQARQPDIAAQSEGKAPLYKTVHWDINSTLPISIQFIGNTRIGSSSFKREIVSQLLDEIDADPWRFLVATRRLINQGTASRHDRFETLQNLAELLSRGKNSLLGIMITDELRRDIWGRSIGKGEEKVDPLYPGDWLFYESRVRGIPLIMPETIMRINMKGHEYILYLRDKLSHLTSIINPFHGLTRISEIWGFEADVLVGGHTEVVGWRTWMRPTGQLEIIVPGGFAEYVEKGIGNRVDYPLGGQGVVLFPKRKLIFSFATMDDLRDYHKALWFFEGLNQLNQKDMLSLSELKKKFKLTKRR